MRFEKVLLITPPVTTKLGPVRPNIGLGYLAQALLDNKIEYDILDMLLGYSLKDLLKKINEFRPDLLGISLFSNKYKTAYRILSEVKKYFPGLKIAAGGAHISCLKERVLEECPPLDYGVFLEGEFPLLELCKGRGLEEIENLIYRNNANIVVNKPRPFISNLDSFAFPRYEKFEMNKYINEKSVISSRGCPHQCTYCAVKVVSGRQVRLRSPGNVVDEIEYWYKKGCRQFSFQDDNFILTEKRANEIFDEIETRGMTNLFLRCAGARADRLSRNLLERMKKAGVKTIAIGVEVGNDKMLGIIKKDEKFEDIDKAVKDACELGFDVYLNFLAGVPFETLSDIEDSINFALKYPVFYAEWSNVIPYPGTELYDWLKGKKYLLKEPQEYLNTASTTSTKPVFETPELSYKDRKRIMTLLRKVRNKVLRKGVRIRLQHRGIPLGIRFIISFLVSFDLINKYLYDLIVDYY